MDIETGEKWVKLLDEDESDTSTKTTQEETNSSASTSHSLMIQDEKKMKRILPKNYMILQSKLHNLQMQSYHLMHRRKLHLNCLLNHRGSKI